MRAVVQRVSEGSVSIDGRCVGRCGPGFVVLVGVHRSDVEENASKLADRITGLRILNDAAGKMNHSLLEMPASDEPQILAISNFTVYGDASKSRRPSFTESAGFEVARGLFDLFLSELSARGIRVESGEFGADMQVTLTNDGPVTLILDA